jgi:tripartite-type tricarboxylate transporter receptor subunit TctC
MRRTGRWIATLAAAAMLLAAGAAAAAYPDRRVRLVVPFPAGGGADFMARALAQKLSAQLGQPVVLDHRAGAGGTIAAEVVAGAAPDGYTLVFGTVGTHAINVSLYAKLRYDPVRDFAPVSLTHLAPRVLVVHPSVPAQTVPELIALARAKPGELTFGSAGSGGTNHLSGELFKSMAGIDLVHVPYKGSAPASVDLLGGRITLVFDSIVAWGDHIKTGKVRALGVTSLRRSAALPDVPTIAESGLAGFDVANWLGVLAPAGTPKDAIARLNAEIRIAMADAEMQRQLVAVGIDPTYSTPEAFAELIRAYIPKWAKVVRASGARAD